jgi:two-component system phosphate regulon sensor histidine kinase PhoR
MKRETAAELEFVRAGIEAAGVSYLDALAEQARFLPDTPRITLIAQDGSVLFDNEYDAGMMENHSERPEVKAAREGKTGESIRFSSTLGRQTYYRAVKLEGWPEGSPKGAPYGGSVMRIAVNMDSVTSSALALAPLTMAVVLAIFICAAIIAAKITRRIVRPLNALNLETPEENNIYDELSPLLLRIKAQNGQIKKQMAELRKKQLEFEAIADNMREGLLLLDREGRILSCNRSALKLLCIQPPAPENHSVLALRRDEPFREALEKVLAGESAECSLSAESSRLRLMASPVMDGGKLQGAAILLLDVTEREDREKLRREFSANVSHELKTPLTVISGYAELLLMGLVKPDDIPAFAGKMYREAKRLINLINDVMQLSRLDEGAAGLERKPVDLYTLALTVAEEAMPVALSRNIRVTVEGEEAVIDGFPQVLHEMAFNLVDNAIKYNRDGGEVVVSVTRDEKAVRLSVADTGCGIPPAERERVFERFYRLDKSRNTESGGTGLGLSIVKHGAQLHGAAIELDGGDTGTVICLVFPPGLLFS